MPPRHLINLYLAAREMGIALDQDLPNDLCTLMPAAFLAQRIGLNLAYSFKTCTHGYGCRELIADYYAFLEIAPQVVAAGDSTQMAQRALLPLHAVRSLKARTPAHTPPRAWLQLFAVASAPRAPEATAQPVLSRTPHLVHLTVKAQALAAHLIPTPLKAPEPIDPELVQIVSICHKIARRQGTTQMDSHILQEAISIYQDDPHAVSQLPTTSTDYIACFDLLPHSFFYLLSRLHQPRLADLQHFILEHESPSASPEPIHREPLSS